jgi:hypothetical protein
VATVVETIRQHDNSVEDTAEYLDVPVAHVEECEAVAAVRAR